MAEQGMTVVCRTCGLANPGPEHLAHEPLLCSDTSRDSLFTRHARERMNLVAKQVAERGALEAELAAQEAAAGRTRVEEHPAWRAYRDELAERVRSGPLSGFDRRAAGMYVGLNRILTEATTIEQAQRIAREALEADPDA